jgi:hypothetical protein
MRRASHRHAIRPREEVGYAISSWLQVLAESQEICKRKVNSDWNLNSESHAVVADSSHFAA